MEQAVTSSLIFQTIAVILIMTAIGIILVNKKTKEK